MSCHLKQLFQLHREAREIEEYYSSRMTSSFPCIFSKKQESYVLRVSLGVEVPCIKSYDCHNLDLAAL